MAEFAYQGVDRAGKKVSGKLEAASEGDLRMALRAQGVRPTRISRGGGGIVAKAARSGTTSGGVPIDVLVTFTRQLQVLIGSGIPLVQGLEILIDQANNARMKAIITEIRDKVSSGSYLWQTIQAYPQVFPKLYVALIRAGEASGSMDQMLKRLSRYLEDADRLRKMLKSASMYPTIVISIGIGVIALMLIFVIPKFEELLKGSGQELPAPTQFVIDASHFLVGNALYLVVGGGVAFYLLRRYFRSDEGRAFRDRVLFRAPIFGVIMQKGGVARFARTMQTLLASGVNLVDAIDICKSTIDNAVLEAAVGTIRSEIEAGKTLGAVVSQLTVFPKMATQMISVGEQTGNLDQMLDKVADFYEAEVETLVAGLTKLIEPFVLVFLGGTVGGLMIAMYLPIFKLAGGAE
jgi:type IV pilus assembly protein PilC